MKSFYFLLWIVVCILVIPAGCTNPGASYDTESFKYAIVVSSKTNDSPEWKKVVEALDEKYSDTQLFIWQSEIKEIKKELKKYNPKYVCFVIPPEEMTKSSVDHFEPNPIVKNIHIMLRDLDNDPYEDAIWGIITGYDVDDALRIAKQKQPLFISNGTGATKGWIEYLDSGVAYSETEDNTYFIKSSETNNKALEKTDGPLDVTEEFAEQINSNKVDILWSSSHATENDFSGFRHNKETGSIIPEDGQLKVISLNKDEVYSINSDNPKIYLAAGNCLIGNINQQNCMLTAWLHSGGVYQFVGYTNATWFGYIGWGVGKYFFEMSGDITFAEAFYSSNIALIYELNSNKAMDNRTLQGLTYDKNAVAFYGDPAWEVRPEKQLVKETPLLIERNLTTTSLSKNKVRFELEITANSSTVLERPVVEILPFQVKKAKVVYATTGSAVCTDNFILFSTGNEIQEGTKIKITVEAQKLS